MSTAVGDGARAAASATRTVPLSALVGREVRDSDGRVVGRIEELTAEIELHAHGSSYVVTHVAIGRHRWFDLVLSGQFVPAILRRGRQRIRYRRYDVPWHALDLRDPDSPRLRGHRDQFATDD